MFAKNKTKKKNFQIIFLFESLASRLTGADLLISLIK